MVTVLGFVSVIVVCLTVFGVTALVCYTVSEKLFKERGTASIAPSDAETNPLSVHSLDRRLADLDVRMSRISDEVSSHSVALGMREVK